MKVRDNNRYKEWERLRRDRLTDAFKTLVQLLPNYDPAKLPPKIDILDNSTQFIKELRLSNSRLLSTQTQPTELTTKIKHLQDEVNKLILRVKQLTALLVKAKIPIPTGPSIKSLGKKRLKWANKLKVQNNRENTHTEEMLTANHTHSTERKDKTTITVIESCRKENENTKHTEPRPPTRSADSTFIGKEMLLNGSGVEKSQSQAPPTPTLTLHQPTFFLAPIQTQTQQLFRLHISSPSVPLLPKVCLQTSPLQKIPIRPITRPRLPKRKKTRTKGKVKVKKGKTESGTQTSSNEEVETKIQNSNSEGVHEEEPRMPVMSSQESSACLPLAEVKVTETGHAQVSSEFKSLEGESAEAVAVEGTEVENECQILNTEFLVTEHDGVDEASEKENVDEVTVEGRGIRNESSENTRVESTEESMELSLGQIATHFVSDDTSEKDGILLDGQSSNVEEVRTDNGNEKTENLIELPERISNHTIPTPSIQNRAEEGIQRVERNESDNFEVCCPNVTRDTIPQVEDKISECIARSIGIIEATSEETETELMELGTDWDVGETHSHSSKSPISPTQMFLSMFPLLPRESLSETPSQSNTTHRSLEQKQQGSRSSFYIDAMLPDETPPPPNSNSNYDMSQFRNSLGVMPIGQQRPIHQPMGEELKRHSTDSLDSILAPLQTLKDKRHSDILSLSAFLNIHDPPDTMKGNESSLEKRQDLETTHKKPILTPLQTVQSTQVHHFQSFTNQSQQDSYHHKDPFNITPSLFLNTFPENTFHNSFSPSPASTPSRSTSHGNNTNTNYILPVVNFESSRTGERKSRKEGRKTSKHAPPPPRPIYTHTTSISTGTSKTPTREQKRSERNDYHVVTDRNSVEVMKSSNHDNYSYGQILKSNEPHNAPSGVNTHSSALLPPVTQGQGHSYAPAHPQVNLYTTEQQFNNASIVTSTRPPFYSSHGGSKSTPFYFPSQLESRNPTEGNGDVQSTSQGFPQRHDNLVNTNFSQMSCYERGGKKDTSNSNYGVQPLPQQYTQTHFCPPPPPAPPSQTQRFTTQHAVPSMEQTTQPKKSMQSFSLQTQSPSTSQGPVNWMTDSPYKKGPSQENLFSVSKLVGVGNSNYCAEALIRQKRNPWDESISTLHNQSIPQQYQTHHQQQQHDRNQQNRTEFDRSQHDRTQYDRTQQDRTQHYGTFPQAQELDFGRSYHFDVSMDTHQTQSQQPPLFIEQDYPQQQQHHHTTPAHSTQFSNFNLSSIFPEINDKSTGVSSGAPQTNAQTHPPTTYYPLHTPRKQ